MYETLLAVPTEIREFYLEEIRKEKTGNKISVSATILGENGEEKQGLKLVDEYQDVTYIIQLNKPELKSKADLERVMKLVKPATVINTFINMVLLNEQWTWFDEYNNYLIELEAANLFNSDLPVISVDENDNDILAPLKELPVKPIKPNTLTIEEYKTLNGEMFNAYNKKIGVDINGFNVSLNKDNADGLVSIKAGYDLAGGAIFPTTFVADNAKGTVKIKLNDYAEYTAFALQFLSARNALFS